MIIQHLIVRQRIWTTNKDKFGSKCEISDKFINNQVAKIGIIERTIELNELKENKNLKKNDGRKQNRIKGIPKTRRRKLGRW